MSTSSLSLALCAMLAVGSVALVGCGNGQDRSATTVSTSTAVSTDVQKAKQDLDEVQSQIKNLRDASDSADLKKMHGDLKKRTAELNDSVDEVIESSDEAVAAGKSQQETWHKQADTFTDADLRSASYKREGNLRVAVDELNAATAALKTEREVYVSLLNQTVAALDLDLSHQGVQGIKPTLARLVDNEAKFRQALNNVADKGKAVGGALNP